MFAEKFGTGKLLSHMDLGRAGPTF